MFILFARYFNCQRVRGINNKTCKIQKFMYRHATNVELECMIIPVITGATGILAKVLKKNLQSIPGNGK